MSVSKINQLNVNALTFSAVKASAHSKLMYVNNNAGKVRIQTPKMYIPSGGKHWVPKNDNDKDSFDIDLSFQGHETNEDIKLFHDKMIQLDNRIKEHIVKNPKACLGKANITLETLEESFYTPIVKVAKNADGDILPYPDRIKIKLDRDEDGGSGKFLSNKRLKTEVLFFDENKERIDVSESTFENDIPKGSEMISIIELVYVAFSKTGVSTKWKLIQAKVFKKQEAITDYAIDDSDDEDTSGDDIDNIPNDFDDMKI